MNYPKKLLQDIYWSFSVGDIPTQEEFVKQLDAYYKQITGKKIPLKWDDILLEFPKLELQYVKYTDDDVEEPFELVEADNGKNFTVKELLYKIHKVGINLEDDDNCYFEGLTYAEDENDGVPIYFLDTGS